MSSHVSQNNHLNLGSVVCTVVLRLWVVMSAGDDACNSKDEDKVP